MKDDTAAILMLNSLNKSSTSNSLVPGCYHIHIQTKFFFIAGLRNLVDRYKSCFSIPVTIFLSLKETHHLVVRKLLMKLLFLVMKITLTQIAIPKSSCGAAKELVSSKHFHIQQKRTSKA